MFPQDVKPTWEGNWIWCYCRTFFGPSLPGVAYLPIYGQGKAWGAHGRIIMDLSFPHGMAVNTNISKDSYLGTDFILTLPSIGHITNKIK